MDWREEYQKKHISAEEAANFVKSGDTVVFTSGREAHAIGLAIAARKEELKNVKIMARTPTFDFGWYDEGWQDSFDVTVAMPTGTCQDAVDARRVDIHPSPLIPFLVLQEERPDILLTEISTPDENGFCSFGNSVWSKKRQIENAKMVIAEVTPNLIRTFGDNYVHVSEIDYFVEHLSSGREVGTGSLAGRAKKEPEPYLKDIAGYVGGLLKDGDTIQIGVGRTTEPLVHLGIFNNKHDLGWHSEATPPGVISAIKNGVITGKCKTVNPGKAVCTSLGGGSKEEMAWANNNPLFNLVDVAYLEDIRVLAAHDNFVAINNALSLDITGQLTAETVGDRWLAAAGGQIPFVFGAILSKGGRSITVMPSTAKDGTISRIVPKFEAGTVVTIQRNCVQYVVTEYGVANLWNKTLRQRAEELIAVAHPKFRAELKKQARKLLWP